ncbi:MAG: hypothetical protein INR71_00390 [Terriglobus roseus]|nr:hypothetical protein [Terriglobus roseus]
MIPWVQTVGYIDTYWTQAAIMIFFSLFAIPLYYFGARLRHTSAKWRLIL